MSFATKLHWRPPAATTVPPPCSSMLRRTVPYFILIAPKFKIISGRQLF
jgi:hypothetical protein